MLLHSDTLSHSFWPYLPRKKRRVSNEAPCRLYNLKTSLRKVDGRPSLQQNTDACLSDRWESPLAVVDIFISCQERETEFLPTLCFSVN